MRIGKLDLIRYGKFTDADVVFPQATRDFHFLVGPNEAGKSTVRTAIAELLYGMPHSSPLDFVHPQSELLIGATLEEGAATLTFRRSKSRRGSLSDVDGDTLPNDALEPFLGGSDRAFFEQMFCLDHTALIRGGQSILDASSDVGQVLFQSAAGVASLGRVREALDEEAKGLWAPRKSADRKYYIAQKQLDEAGAELKQAVVRTSAWRAAQAALDDANERKDAAARRRLELELERDRLERMRRVAPQLGLLRERSEQLQALGDVTDLPAGALATLHGALESLADARVKLQLHTESASECEQALGQVQVDETALALAPEIEALEKARHRCATYGDDIARLEHDVARRLADVAQHAAQLHWPEDEAAMRARVPSALALQTVESLLRERGKLEQARAHAEQTAQAKHDAIVDLEARVAKLPAPDVPDDLQAALRAAQRHRDGDSARRLETAMHDAKRALDAALAALGTWTRDVAALRTMKLPSAEHIAALRAGRDDLDTRLQRARDRLDAAKEAHDEAVTQSNAFEAAHRVVTHGDVLAARDTRDTAWRALRDGGQTLAEGASAFESSMAAADALSDREVASVTHVAQQAHHRERVAVADATRARQQAAHDEAVHACETFERDWHALMLGAALDGLTPDDCAAWIARRDTALDAADTLGKAQADASRDAQDRETCRARLAQSLAALQSPADSDDTADSDDVDALCVAAERHIAEAHSAGAKRTLLDGQLDTARAERASARRDAATHSAAHDTWRVEWQAALDAAGLASVASANASAAEAAIGVARTIRDTLDAVRQMRDEQIDVKQRESDAFVADAKRLAQASGHTHSQDQDGNEPFAQAIACSVALSQRLATARIAAKEREQGRQRLAHENTRVKQARAEVDEADAQLRPLYALAAVDTADLLAPLITRSDTKRELNAAIDAARARLADEGDGLSIDELSAEIDASDPGDAQARRVSVSAELQESVETGHRIATEVANADAQLATIAGAANAAIAESKRQEALSAMADAAERFVKVETASTLLRWAVDRYRERRQGPMLSRASAIFSVLTLGGFDRLSVDYDHQPIALSAMRASGERVPITGMSEGTRDQLYLALRLAALEWRCERAAPMPFIADDLFINFDDRRARAGLRVLAEIAKHTQVIFLSHHDHLVEIVREVFGAHVNVREMG